MKKLYLLPLLILATPFAQAQVKVSSSEVLTNKSAIPNQPQVAVEQKKKSRWQITKKERFENGLLKAFNTISHDFVSILKEYEVLKKAAPAEYSYYLSKLTSTIIDEVEEGHVHAYCGDPAKEFFKALTANNEQLSREMNSGPLKRFKNHFLIQAIGWLESLKKKAKGTSLDTQVDLLVFKLKDLKKILQGAK